VAKAATRACASPARTLLTTRAMTFPRARVVLICVVTSLAAACGSQSAAPNSAGPPDTGANVDSACVRRVSGEEWLSGPLLVHVVDAANPGGVFLQRARFYEGGAALAVRCEAGGLYDGGAGLPGHDYCDEYAIAGLTTGAHTITVEADGFAAGSLLVDVPAPDACFEDAGAPTVYSTPQKKTVALSAS